MQTADETKSNLRFHQLDALRGIAAATVVFSHFAQLKPFEWVWHTPLRLLAGGHEAVLLFFVLSGFALSMQLSSKTPPRYGEFVIKRICRIYIPYISVFLMTAGLMALTYRGPVDWTDGWFNTLWTRALNRGDYLNHVIFLGSYPTVAVPVIWSLIYEMRVSLLFPLIFYMTKRAHPAVALAVAAVLSVGAFVLEVKLGKSAEMSIFDGDYAMTAHYVAMFIVGSLLAIHRHAWIPVIKTGRRPFAILAVALLLYFLTRRALFNHHGAIVQFAFDWLVSAGSAGIIAAAIVSRRISSFMLKPAIRYLGMISFSLYLTHLVVILAISHLLPGKSSESPALWLSAILILPVAAATYHWIERPSMLLGRRLFRARTGKRVSPTAS